MSENVLSNASQQLLDYVYQIMSNLIYIETYTEDIIEEFSLDHIQGVVDKFNELFKANDQELKIYTIALPETEANHDIVVNSLNNNTPGTNGIFFANRYKPHDRGWLMYFILSFKEFSFGPGCSMVQYDEDVSIFYDVYRTTLDNFDERFYFQGRPAMYFRQFPMCTEHEIITNINYLSGPFNRFQVAFLSEYVNRHSKKFKNVRTLYS